MTVILLLALCVEVGAVGRDDKLELARHLQTIKPAAGFIDSPLAMDDAGKRVAYIVADAAGHATAFVRELGGEGLESISIAALGATPTSIAIISPTTVFVSGRTSAGDEVGGVFTAEKRLRKFGPATRVRLVRRGGKDQVSLYRTSTRRGVTTHTAEARDLTSGKRLGKRTSLATDASGKDARRGFILEYWLDEHLVAVGTHIGTYNKKADQRMPDQRGRLDMTTGEVARRDIVDLIAHRTRSATLKSHSGERAFLDFAVDRSTLRLFEDGTPREIALAEAINHYEPASLVYRPGAEGAMHFTVRIDPVHPDAAAAKRAVPAWIDLYVVGKGESKAVRLARLQPARKGDFDWRAGASHWVLLPKHVGFSRGGPRLEIVELMGDRPITKTR